MRTITNDFKTELKTMGKEIDAKITYTINSTSYTLGADDLNSVKPHYESGILKSTMKELEIDSNIDIPLGTIIECQFGIKVNGSFEYMSYGHYVVYSSEKQEDLYSYKITCYDKMLYSMKDYEAFATYPITIRDYLTALCTQIGLTFKNASDTFTNYDKTLDKELYLDENGNSLNYTYRDVLDELAQVTASTICINEDDDTLEIRYITNAGEQTTNTTGTNLSITSEDSQVNKTQLLGNTTQSGTPTPSSPQNVNTVTGLQEIKAVGKNLINAIYYNANNYVSQKLTLELGEYYVSYVGDNASAIYLRKANGSTPINGTSVKERYNGTTLQFTINEKGNYYIQFYLGGNGFTNFKECMLNTGTTASTYEPYQEQVSEINLGKNLIPNNLTSGSSSGVTYVVNSDGSIHIKGTASARIEPDLFNNSANPIIFEPGTYKNTSNRMIIVYANAGYNVFNANSTVTFSEQKRATRIYFRVENGETNLDETFYPQIIKNGVDESYAPYFTPIELCKIDTYQDKIFKTSGKNLADISKIAVGKSWSGSAYSQRATILWIPIEANQKYNLVASWTNSNITNIRVVLGHGASDPTNNYIPNSFPFTNTTWEYASIEVLASTTFTSAMLDGVKIMLCKGEDSDYEPYSNNEWYIKKAIGKKILNGSENWGTIGDNRYWVAFPDKRGLTSQVPCLLMSNYFKAVQYAGGAVGIGEMTEGYYTIANYNVFFNYNGSNTDLAGFKTWLSTHNTIVYYVLSTPTYTKITNTDLIEQLNSIRLLEGLNNITTNVPIDLTYVSGIDTLDEEYFNEDNVNFGEMYGPVNTIILSRSAESDEIAQSIPSNLSDDEKVAIKIKENQILNFDNRDEFLYGILTRLYGLRYTQNDYSSKGICYYNVCDRYKATIFGKDYYCVMLNDDVTIESGLSENVFTELPEVAETDYSKTSTTDKMERKTTLIVDKQVGEIRGEISTIDDQLNGANGVVSKLNAQGQTLDIWSKSFDENGNVIALNTTNYTFDNEGLKIGKSTDDYNSLQDNTGTYYYEKDTMTGKYTKEGSVQKDMALFGRYYYGIDEENFDVSTFSLKDANFVAQWYDNGTEEGFGHFWNGE